MPGRARRAWHRRPCTSTCTCLCMAGAGGGSPGASPHHPIQALAGQGLLSCHLLGRDSRKSLGCRGWAPPGMTREWPGLVGPLAPGWRPFAGSTMGDAALGLSPGLLHEPGEVCGAEQPEAGTGPREPSLRPPYCKPQPRHPSPFSGQLSSMQQPAAERRAGCGARTWGTDTGLQAQSRVHPQLQLLTF